jgi:hypothetical protein
MIDEMGYQAAKEAYSILLRIPYIDNLDLFLDAQPALSKIRDYIAEVEGRTAFEVQEEYEQKVMQLQKLKFRK